MSLELSGCGDSGGLSLNLSLNGACCGTGTRVVELNVTELGRDLIRITQDDFANATQWNGINSENVTIKTAYSFKLFYNDGNRYLDEGTEWQRTSTGFEILMSGFDATANAYTIYVHINRT